MRTRMLLWLVCSLLTTHSLSLSERRRLGKYTTKEIVEKAPAEVHPCNLTRTAVKVSFPDMQDELFVNLIGYKEPNIVHLARCKGLCGLNGSSVGCQATRVRQKSVKMLLMTQLTNREPKERIKELVLDEHLECGCICKDSGKIACTGNFNTTSCECHCDDRLHGERRKECERRRNSYWDTGTCTCRRQNTLSRRAGTRQTRCSNFSHDHRFLSSSRMRNILMLSIFLVITLILLATTLHYRRKYKYRQTQQTNLKNLPTQQILKAEEKREKKKKVKKPKVEVMEPLEQEVIESLLGRTEYELYGDQEYDQHGVRIDHQYIA